MNKLLVILMFELISCEDKSDTKLDLLLGDWDKKTVTNIGYRPKVTFYLNGEYRICDLFNNREVIITGKFNFKRNEIEFITASVEYNNNSTHGNTDINIQEGSVLSNSTAQGSIDNNSNNVNTRIPVIIANYSPMIWKVLILTDKQLKVLDPPIDTLTYER